MHNTTALATSAYTVMLYIETGEEKQKFINIPDGNANELCYNLERRKKDMRAPMAF